MYNRHELAERLGIEKRLLDQWTKDETIPPHFYERGIDGTRGCRYAPITAAVIELMLDLGRVFGVNSPLPKRIVRQLVPQIERAWREPELPTKLTVQAGDIELNTTLSFLKRAASKLAAA